jgi:hypothetical protein
VLITTTRSQKRLIKKFTCLITQLSFQLHISIFHQPHHKHLQKCAAC